LNGERRVTRNKWYKIEKLLPDAKVLTQCISDEGGALQLEVGKYFDGKGLFDWIVTAYVGCTYSYPEYGIMLRYNEEHELDYLDEQREHVEMLLAICQANPDTLEHVPYILRWLDKNNRAGDQPGPEGKLRL